MVSFFEKAGLSDSLRIEVVRGGKVVDWRQSINPHGVKAKWIHFWQFFGFYKNYMDDLITSAGKAAIVNRMVTDTETYPFSGIAIGEGTTPATVDDVALESESMRVAGSLTRYTTTVANDTYEGTGVFDITETLAITESGVLDNSSTGGNLITRQVFGVLNLLDGDQITFVWRIVVA